MGKATKFFHFGQNNSGGSFDFDPQAGITHHVIIEAVDAEHAEQRAEAIGLYFGGCETGQDCPCCGDRWSRVWGDGDDVPSIYGQDIRSDGGYRSDWGEWMDKGREVCIHPVDGPLEWYGVIVEGRANA